METKSGNEPTKLFDLFELLTAILLGLGAIGAAVAGHQNGLWGGIQSESFSEAATMTTKAATLYNEGVADLNQDYGVDLQAKKEILEAINSEDEAEKASKFEIASNLYTRYLTVVAYEDLGLPKDLMTADETEGQDEEYEEAKQLDEKTLMDSVESELSDKYIEKMLDEANQEFDNSDKRFAEGKIANTNSDGFSFLQVIFSISLFFAGLGMIFKTSIRWGLLGLSGAVFLYAAIQMAMLPWV